MAERGVQTSAAQAAVAYLGEISPELRGCAILDASGALLAASGPDGERWRAAALELLSAADKAGEEPVAHAHVATADGEVFCVRQDGLIAVAVTERFVLASLMFFDLRAALRDLLAGAAPEAR